MALLVMSTGGYPDSLGSQHASMLVEPFLPNVAHSSGDAFTDDRAVIRERRRRKRKDKWFKRMEELDGDAGLKAANGDTELTAGNPIVNRDGSFIRYRKGEMTARQREPDEKYQRFLDLLGTREYNPAPSQRVDYNYGDHAKDGQGRIVHGGGTFHGSYTPDDGDAIEKEMEALYEGVGEEEELEYRTGTYIHQPYSTQRVGEYNRSRDAGFD